MSSCFVDLDSESIEIVEKHILTKIDDILHRFIDKKYLTVQDTDIVIQYNELEISITIRPIQDFLYVGIVSKYSVLARLLKF